MPPSTNRSSMEAQNGSAYSTSQLDFPPKISHSGGFRNKAFISPRTATTTSTATITTKISLTTVHPCQWRQPELSIGAPCQSMDVLGRYKCWSLKDNSPAHIIWKTLSKAIIALLQGQMEHLASRDSDLMVEMFMIGRKVKSSSPTVLFSCESKSCRQQALELLKRKSILGSYPGVLAAQCSQLPRLLALGEVMEMHLLPSGVYVNGPLRSCGMDVLISAGPHRPPRKATVGGIVCIDNDYYGLTCFHAFSEAKAPDVREDRDLEFAFYGLNDDHGLDSDDEDDSVDTASQGSISSRSSQSLPTKEVVNLQASLQKLDQSFAEREQDLRSGASAESKRQVTEPTLLGTFFAGGPPTSSLDWALVKIELWGFLLPFPTTSLDPKMDITVGKIISGDRVVYPKHIARATADARVLICTGSTDTAYEGTLSTVASFTKAAGTEKFQELWSVRRLDGSFVDGDCGSWVVDFESGVLYGHIVSGYPGTGSAYVVPAVQIFYDMKKYLGKTVQLSTAERKASLLLSNRLETTNLSEAAGIGIDAMVSLDMNQPAKDSKPSEQCLPSSSCFVGSSAMIMAEGDVNANVSDNTISSPISSLAPFTSAAFPPSQSLIENPEFPREALIMGDNRQGYGNRDLLDIQSGAHSPSLFHPHSPDQKISAHAIPFGGWSLINHADSNIQVAAQASAQVIESHFPITNAKIIFQSKELASYLVEASEGYFLFADDLKEGQFVSTSLEKTCASFSGLVLPFDREIAMEPNQSPQANMSTPLSVNGMEETTQIPSSIPSPTQISRSPSASVAVIDGNLVPVVPSERHTAEDKRAIRTDIQTFETEEREEEALRAEKPAGCNPPMPLYISNILSSPIDTSKHGFGYLFPKPINLTSVDDDETGELLKNPVAYAENGPFVQARPPTDPEIPISRVAGLSLNANSAAGPASLNSFATPTALASMSHANPMSPTTLTNGGPPVDYQLGSQHYQRHNFPPLPPSDQNPPCNVLYVGNLPIDTSEDELKAMFSKQRGYKRLCFRTKQNGPMCFVEFEDVSFAMKARLELYGHPLHNSIKGGIRLSFSKNPLGVRSEQGMWSPGPQNVPGVMQGMNEVILGGDASTFSTASGPPPGLVAPAGLGPSRMGYSVTMGPMIGPASQYAAASFAGNSNG